MTDKRDDLSNYEWRHDREWVIDTLRSTQADLKKLLPRVTVLEVKAGFIAFIVSLIVSCITSALIFMLFK